jgi:hypothetical protein
MLLLTNIYRSALKGKGGQWTAGNLDKWLKSPADYAPGKQDIYNTHLNYRQLYGFRWYPQRQGQSWPRCLPQDQGRRVMLTMKTSLFFS